MRQNIEIEKAARAAARTLSLMGRTKKDLILKAMADGLTAHKDEILAANKIDVENARKNGISESMIDRLQLTAARIDSMAQGLIKVSMLDDPTDRILGGWVRPNGLRIEKRCVPLGVVGVIYEARPNVTADVVGLCLKSGNAAVLRGGKEAINSNMAVMRVLVQAGVESGMPEGAVGLIEDTSRDSAMQMMKANGLIDVLIPRGGAGLIRSVVENSTVPVIETGVGVCHTFIDETADFAKALDIVINAKCSRPSVCNAMETLLVHESVAKTFLERAVPMLEERGVELRGCGKTCGMFKNMKEALEDDWATEYNDLILSVKIVNDLDEAIEHINQYGTGHSEAIVTDSESAAARFLNEVSAACVYVNASTRFTDGEEFGFGAEIGISTQMLHARGPMGLEALTTVKYAIRGNGQIR